MFENIWRGIQLNYFYGINHSLQILSVLLFILLIALLRILFKIWLNQQQVYTELLDQQQQIQDIQYRLGRITRVCHESRDKQRFISNQLQKVDNSIFELEEALTRFKEKLNHNSPMAVYEFEKE